MTKTTPAGHVPGLYENMAKQTHLLIAGTTGSGKSTVINGLIFSLMYRDPAKCKLILADPKKVELYKYHALPHCIFYSDETPDILNGLSYAVDLMEKRFVLMRDKRETLFSGSDVYIIIDELADLVLTSKQAFPLLQRLAQKARAAKIHLVLATQCPLREVIPTPIKCNIDSRIGLRTRSRQDSRNIIETPGCEMLPRYGYGYYMTPETGIELVTVPMIPETETARLLNHWK